MAFGGVDGLLVPGVGMADHAHPRVGGQRALEARGRGAEVAPGNRLDRDGSGRIRREAYAAYAIAFVGVFIYLFSALGNFGILARQRVQMLPFLFVLLSLPLQVDARAANNWDEAH